MSAAQHMRLQTYARTVAYANIGILYKMAMQDIRSLTVDPFTCDVFNGKGRPTERNWSVWLYSYLDIVRVLEQIQSDLASLRRKSRHIGLILKHKIVQRYVIG